MPKKNSANFFVYANLVILASFGCTAAWSEILQVGPELPIGVPSHAAAIAKDGDIIEIAEGEYWGDVAIWRQKDLTIRGTGDGALLHANGQSAEGKAIWVIAGQNVAVENIEFSGAHVPDRNGSGIRFEGTNLTVRRCRFHDNDNGILSGRGAGAVTIENSVFSDNGYGDGQSHNIYIGEKDSLTIFASYFHDAIVGHNIKSRARETTIAYSKIEDGRHGRSSYLVDIPNGGRAVLIGNVLQQGPDAENGTLIAYGLEMQHPDFGEVFLINNTMVNDRHNGLFLRNANPLARAHFQNNIFFGPGEISDREFRDVSNLVVTSEKTWFGLRKVFRDRELGNYRLAEESKAIDAGTHTADFGLDKFYPKMEYRDIALAVDRMPVGELDIGAYEYSSN